MIVTEPMPGLTVKRDRFYEIALGIFVLAQVELAGGEGGVRPTFEDAESRAMRDVERLLSLVEGIRRPRPPKACREPRERPDFRASHCETPRQRQCFHVLI